MPASTCSKNFGGSFDERCTKYARSTAKIWSARATCCLPRREVFAGSSVHPGAEDHARLLVSGTQTTVASRLRLSESPCTTTTGRRKPAAEPPGEGRSAHHTSPRETS